MISVGVDIDRLGLMVITGQPKIPLNIQSSSRVGRQKPGLVFALYNQNRSRDRSHFENFKGYHQALYRFVEPTSVTPYSYKCRERSLPGLIVGIARHIVGMPNPRSIDSYKDKIINYLDEYKKRVDNADLGDDELDMLDAQIEKIFEVWTQQERYNDDLSGAPSYRLVMLPNCYLFLVKTMMQMPMKNRTYDQYAECGCKFDS